MEKAGGPISAVNLDARLLRYRNRADSEPASRLSRDLLDAGRVAEALEVATTGLSVSPDDPELLVVEGRAWLREGDLIRSQAALLKAARIAAHSKEPFRWLGEVLLKRGDPSRAAKVLERAAALDPNDREIKLLVGRAERLSRIDASGASGAEEQPTTVAGRALAPDDFGDDFNTDEGPTAVVQVDAQGRMVLPGEGDEDTNVERPPATVARPGPPRMDPPGFRDKKMTAMGLGPQNRVDEPFGPDPFGDAPTNTVPSKKQPAAFAAPPVAASFPQTRGQDGPRPPPVDPYAHTRMPDARPRERENTYRAPAYDAPPPREAPPPPPMFPPPRAAYEPSPEPYRPARSPYDADGDRDLGGGHAYGDGPAYGGGPIPAPTPDVAGGAAYGREENVDVLLTMLQKEGIFEPPSGQVGEWAPQKEARKGRVGTRIWPVLAAVWIIALALATGGYFGWQEFVKQRKAEAARLTAEAHALALAGDHDDLVDAERKLVQARDLDPTDTEGPAILLLVHAQRALEDGTFDPGFLRPSIARAERAHVREPLIKAAISVLAAGEGDMDAARESATQALADGGDDAGVLYMTGRVEQRIGADTALEHLEAAVAREPNLVAAVMALAEARADEGQRDRAIELVDAVLADERDHLRAMLWRAFLTADEADPDAGLAALAGLADRIEQHGAATDRVLSGLTRGRLLRRNGDAAAATESVDGAAQAGATEPRLLALVATEAQSVGLLNRAQTAATEAVRGAPTNVDFRKLLAAIFLQRRDGMRALRTLATMSMEDPEVLRMSAEAALVVGGDDALTAAETALNAYLEANSESDEPNVEVKALLIRTIVALGRATEVLATARDLVRDTPGDPHAALALGEVGLAVRDPRIAVDALERLVTAAPEDAEGHYMLGRARRLNGEPDEAERSLRRAVELLPSHTDAQMALGRLLLDRGSYEEADTIYTELARQGGVASGASIALVGRLGRVEALVGLGRLEDATVQIESLQTDDANRAVARVARAVLELAKHNAGAAVTAIRPLAEAESPPADVMALYGDALFEAGETEAAAEQYNRALERDAGLPEAIIGKARVAVRAESARDAVRYVDDAKHALSERVRPPRLMARALVLEGRAHLLSGRDGRERARDALRRAVEIPAVDPEAWFFLGEALAGENAPEARAAYERYVELDARGPYARRARAALR